MAVYVSQEVAPFLFRANLFAVIKKSGGYRPVAVGDILRRLTSKVIMREVAGPGAHMLRPLQFGVGVRGGCKAVVHATPSTVRSSRGGAFRWTSRTSSTTLTGATCSLRFEGDSHN